MTKLQHDFAVLFFVRIHFNHAISERRVAYEHVPTFTIQFSRMRATTHAAHNNQTKLHAITSASWPHSHALYGVKFGVDLGSSNPTSVTVFAGPSLCSDDPAGFMIPLPAVPIPAPPAPMPLPPPPK